jgi:hypothetical protein
VGSTEESPAKKVLFKSPDGAFSSITAMSVGRHQLVLHFIGGEETLQVGGCLIVESLEFRSENRDCEFFMDVIISLDPFLGGPGFHQDGFRIVAVINIAGHDI